MCPEGIISKKAALELRLVHFVKQRGVQQFFQQRVRVKCFLLLLHTASKIYNPYCTFSVSISLCSILMLFN